MKKVTLTLVCLSIFSILCFAQSPQLIPYQAVARNSGGNLIASQSVGLRFTVRTVSSGGSIEYRETQTSTTNELGLFSTNIGSGTIVSGTMAGISWGTDAKFLQVEIDPTGGTTYIDMGTTQLVSVPYAMYAASSGGSGFPTNVASETAISSTVVVASGYTTLATVTIPSIGTYLLSVYLTGTETGESHTIRVKQGSTVKAGITQYGMLGEISLTHIINLSTTTDLTIEAIESNWGAAESNTLSGSYSLVKLGN